MFMPYPKDVLIVKRSCLSGCEVLVFVFVCGCRQAIGGNDKSELRRHGVLVFYKLMVSFGGPRAATIYSD